MQNKDFKHLVIKEQIYIKDVFQEIGGKKTAIFIRIKKHKRDHNG
jgi:hypothetical protein